MNIIAVAKNIKLEASFHVDELSSKDAHFVRAKEKREAFLFSEVQQLMTTKGMRENFYYGIYGTKHFRNRFDECGRVSLTSLNRTD